MSSVSIVVNAILQRSLKVRITVGRVIGCAGVALVSLAGCRNAPGVGQQSDSRLTRVTFAKDVAPIVFQKCAECHRPGQSAPFSLLDYQDVRQRAHTIVSVTERRFMPPWLPEQGYGEFAGERRLTTTEIETIRRWEEQGALEGNPADLPSPPQFADGWRLGAPDLVIKLPQPYTLRADGTEVWRNFVISVPLSLPRYVKTVEIHPGNPRVVHHGLMGIDPTRSSRRRDEKDDEAGFEGMDMGDSLAPDGQLLGWTPGMAPFPGIKDKTWRLDARTDLVLQLHLIPSGKPEVIDPIIGLYFAERAPVGPPMYLMRLDADQAIDIPPGEKTFVVTDTFELPVDVELLAVYPHAHFLATTMEGLARLPNGAEQRLLRIHHWDFKWQDVYRYARPIPLSKGTTISMRYSYDNSADNPRNPSRPPKRVVAGLRSVDEMAHLQLQVLPRSGEDALLLKEAVYRHAIQKSPGDAWAYYELGNALRDRDEVPEAIRQYRAAIQVDPSHAASRNNLGAVLAAEGDVDEAIRQYRQALRLEPDFADAHYNLGNALRSKGVVDEAIGHYRQALRLEPEFAEAHNNLGEVLASLGKLDEAIAEFRTAVRVKPDSAEAENNLGAGLGLQGKLDEAIGHLRQALQIAPGHAGARENLRIALEKAAAARGGKGKALPHD